MSDSVWIVIRSDVDNKGNVIEVERHVLYREPLEGFTAWTGRLKHIEVLRFDFAERIYPKPASSPPPPLEDLKGHFVVVQVDGAERDGSVERSSDSEIVVRLWRKHGPQLERADEVVTIPRSGPWRLKYPRRRR